MLKAFCVVFCVITLDIHPDMGYMHNYMCCTCCCLILRTNPEFCVFCPHIVHLFVNVIVSCCRRNAHRDGQQQQQPQHTTVVSHITHQESASTINQHQHLFATPRPRPPIETK